MKQRTFTLDEAQVLLPVLESLLRRSIEGKQQVEKIEAEFEEVRQRIFLGGGTLALHRRLQQRLQHRQQRLRLV